MPARRGGGKKDEQHGATQYDADIFRAKQKTLAKFIDAGFGFGKTAVRGSCWVAVAYCGYLAIDSVSGETTTVNSIVNWAFKMRADQAVAYIVSALSGGAWYRERKLRQGTIREKSGYEKELERRIDPGRSTSGLLETGAPKKEDRDD